MASIEFNKLADISASCGFEVLSTLSFSQAQAALAGQAANLDNWQSAGYAGEMSYMQRDSSLFTNPSNFLSEAKSVVTFIVPYSNKSNHPSKTGYGRVARYAWGHDYHLVIKSYLHQLINEVELLLSREINFRCFTDSVPVLERALSAYAGNGFVGRNSMLIRPGLGSYFFIAEVFWDIEVEQLVTTKRISGRASELPKRVLAGEGCGSCFSCVSECPTSAIVSSGVIDSTKCISYLTIEKRSPFSVAEQTMLGDWIFGCDVCQEVCPFNHDNHCNIFPEFAIDTIQNNYLSLMEVLSIESEREFKSRFKDSPILRAKRAGLIRNACAIVANTKYFEAVQKLIDLSQTDSSGLVRHGASTAIEVLREFSTGLDRRRIDEAKGS